MSAGATTVSENYTIYESKRTEIEEQEPNQAQQ